MKNRIVMFLMALVIFFSSIIGRYEEVKAFDIPTAFWGVLEGGRAMFTAMTAGGGFKNGISLSAIERSSREDVHEFQKQILIGYSAFCIYKEKIRLKLENLGLTDSEINEQATTSGTNMAESFEDNAIKVSNTTKTITQKDYGYWREYCDSVSDIAKNGFDAGSTEGDVYPLTLNNINYSFHGSTAPISDYTFEYNGKVYVYGGTYIRGGEALTNKFTAFYNNVPADRINIPFMWLQLQDGKWYQRLKVINIVKLTGEVVTVTDSVSMEFTVNGDVQGYIQGMIDNTDFPFVITGLRYPASNEFHTEVTQNYSEYLALTSGASSSGEDEAYKNIINDALNNTEFGKAVKEGGASRADVVAENAVPVKKSSVKEGEEVASGAIGWDIPDTATLEGSIAVPEDEEDVRKAMGVISVPEDIIEGTREGVIDWPKDEPIEDTDDEGHVISVPITDVISQQYGEYYPSQIDITQFFPFCIPFDIYYCIMKFKVVEGTAPVLHIPIVYPKALQGVLGESYDVVIDFNEYVALRNVIRYFILLMFLMGLMTMTRTLIRG